MTQVFDAMPDPYEDWFQTPIGRLIKQLELDLILEFTQPQQGETVLDAGCGSGIFSQPLVDAGMQLTGIDLSEPMLERAKQRLPESTFMTADMLDLPFADASFDKSVSITALEFIEDGQRAIAELFRVTKPGGLVVVATLNGLSPWAARRREKALQDPDSVFNHACFRSPDDLLALTSVAGEMRTAIHFPKDATAEDAARIEAEAAGRNENTGAFLIACWRKPL